MFSRSIILCLLNCITETIQATEAQTFSSRVLCGPRASCWVATIDRNSWYRFLLCANMYVAFSKLAERKVSDILRSVFAVNLTPNLWQIYVRTWAWKRLLKKTYLGRNNIELSIVRTQFPFCEQILKTVAAPSSQTLVTMYLTTRLHIPEDKYQQTLLNKRQII